VDDVSPRHDLSRETSETKKTGKGEREAWDSKGRFAVNPTLRLSFLSLFLSAVFHCPPVFLSLLTPSGFPLWYLSLPRYFSPFPPRSKTILVVPSPTTLSFSSFHGVVAAPRGPVLLELCK